MVRISIPQEVLNCAFSKKNGFCVLTGLLSDLVVKRVQGVQRGGKGRESKHVKKREYQLGDWRQWLLFLQIMQQVEEVPLALGNSQDFLTLVATLLDSCSGRDGFRVFVVEDLYKLYQDPCQTLVDVVHMIFLSARDRTKVAASLSQVGVLDLLLARVGDLEGEKPLKSERIDKLFKECGERLNFSFFENSPDGELDKCGDTKQVDDSATTTQGEFVEENYTSDVKVSESTGSGTDTKVDEDAPEEPESLDTKESECSGSVEVESVDTKLEHVTQGEESSDVKESEGSVSIGVGLNGIIVEEPQQNMQIEIESNIKGTIQVEPVLDSVEQIAEKTNGATEDSSLWRPGFGYGQGRSH